jgi:hypothetical protein
MKKGDAVLSLILVKAASDAITDGHHQRNRLFIGFNISTPLCFTFRHPKCFVPASSGLPESCPKIGDVPKSLFTCWQPWCRRLAQ